jgi:hypothetical protein
MEACPFPVCYRSLINMVMFGEVGSIKPDPRVVSAILRQFTRESALYIGTELNKLARGLRGGLFLSQFMVIPSQTTRAGPDDSAKRKFSLAFTLRYVLRPQHLFVH